MEKHSLHSRFKKNPLGSHTRLNFIALLSGALLTLAFAPFQLWVFALISPALLLLLWQHVSPKQAFLRGAFFGLGFFGTGLSWVYVSLKVYGQANAWLAALLTFVMILVLLLYIAAQGYLFVRLFPRRCISSYLLAFPTLWVLAEWARGWFLTGFPWLFLGYSQLTTPLHGLAPLVSVYGISWLVAATSGAIALLLTLAYAKNSAKQIHIFLSCSLILMCWIAGFILQHIHWTQPMGTPIPVSLIQGNIPQTLKWQPEQAEKSLALYRQLTEQHLDSSLIVWPEAAITFSQNQVQDSLDDLSATLISKQATVITGIPILETTDEGNVFYNGMMAIGNGQGAYLKRHLVPFGEFMPLRPLLKWLNNYVQIPMSDFSRGARHQPLIQADGIPIAAFICYEISYPTEVLDALPEGKLIVVISDDSWFGKSIAPAQHLEIAQMRALETGRYLLMSTNDGLTAIIKPNGEIQSVIPRYQTRVLTGDVQPMVGATPWVSIGLYPVMIAFVLLLVIAVLLQKFPKKYSLK